MDKRIIAINLPQFHPFKENDEWWGKGFTEWTNVTKAKPRFPGHYQPHLPSDTGFYDLRLPEARQMQADMAKEAGIYGFCYYHYWFNGKRLMNRPIDEILKSGEPDFPFMLCWANENWSRNWDGGFNDILIEQKYSIVDDEKHMDFLCKNVFVDERYIKVNGKPFFVVYKPFLFPDIKRTIEVWRKTAKKNGFDLYLGFMRNGNVGRKEMLEQGFDVAVEFQPDLISKYPYSTLLSFLKKNYDYLYRIMEKLGISIEPSPKCFLYDYQKYSYIQIDKLKKNNIKQFPCVTPMWDNSARRVGKPYCAFKNSSPLLYGNWLNKVMNIFKPFSKEENFIFVNAWNEWAEGNHLEPDTKWGNQYLKITKDIIKSENK